MKWLYVLAILASTADAAQTCHEIRQGGQELNPLLPSSCGGAIAVKAALLTVPVVLPPSMRKAWLIGITAGAGIGITITIVRR